MGLHEDRIKALHYERPEAIPVLLGILPAAWIKHREKLDAIADRYPDVFGSQRRPNRDYDAVGGTYVKGKHIDPWGYVWENIEHGMEAFVTDHPVKTRADVHTMKIPETDTGFPHGFMFLRLTYLRGYEACMLDFAEEPPELQILIDKVLDYNLSQAEKYLARLSGKPAIAYFGDDLGLQRSLPIHPDTWRKYLKPCFEKLYRPFRNAGHDIYMHTDGHILPIIPDLIDCGVTIVNPQVGANGLDNLAEKCKDKICVDLDLDRQHFPFWTPDEIDAHVREAVEILGAPEGGLWLKAEIGQEIPLENVEAICAALEKYRFYYS